MDLLWELLATAFLAFFFSFIIAKLVSTAMSSSDSPAASPDLNQRDTMEELLLKERLQVQQLDSENRVEFVDEVTGKVDEFSGVPELVSCGGCREFQPQEFEDETKKMEIDEEKLTVPVENDVVVEGGAVELIVQNDVVEERKVAIIDSDDDEWEGIERSELEKEFDKAAKFVASGLGNKDHGSVGSDMEMELYGLHKVATEGPCCENPPLPLMLSARAKCDSFNAKCKRH